MEELNAFHMQVGQFCWRHFAKISLLNTWSDTLLIFPSSSSVLDTENVC